MALEACLLKAFHGISSRTLSKLSVDAISLKNFKRANKRTAQND